MNPFLIDKVELEAFVLVHHHLVDHSSDQVSIKGIYMIELLQQLQIMSWPIPFILHVSDLGIQFGMLPFQLFVLLEQFVVGLVEIAGVFLDQLFGFFSDLVHSGLDLTDLRLQFVGVVDTIEFVVPFSQDGFFLKEQFIDRIHELPFQHVLLHLM